MRNQQVKITKLKPIRLGRKEGKFTHVVTSKKNKSKKYFKVEHERCFLNLIRALQVGDHVEINTYYTLVEKKLREMVRKLVNRLGLKYLTTYYGNGEWENDIIGYIFSKLENFVPEKGRVFSYISVIIVNYAISLNNRIYYQSVGYQKDFYSDNPATEDYQGIESEELSYEITSYKNRQIDFEKFCRVFMQESVLKRAFESEDEQWIAFQIAFTLKYDPDVLSASTMSVVHRMVEEFSGINVSRYKFMKVYKRMIELFDQRFI